MKYWLIAKWCACLCEHNLRPYLGLIVQILGWLLRWMYPTLQWRHNEPNGVSSLFAQLLVQAQIKENIKAPHHWPLCEERSPLNSPHLVYQRPCSNAETVSIWCRHHRQMYIIRKGTNTHERFRKWSYISWHDMSHWFHISWWHRHFFPHCWLFLGKKTHNRTSDRTLLLERRTCWKESSFPRFETQYNLHIAMAEDDKETDLAIIRRQWPNSNMAIEWMSSSVFPISTIFINKSLRIRYFPTEWKSALVKHLLKKLGFQIFLITFFKTYCRLVM